VRRVIAASLVAIALVAAPAAGPAEGGRGVSQSNEAPPATSLERPFASGGRVQMNLSAGEYLITGTLSNRVHLDWSVRDANQLWRVKTRVEVRGTDATIETDGPSNSSFRVEIRVPVKTDLDVDLTAGKITVEGVNGNKAIDSYAGEVNVDIGRADDYRSIDASVWAGEIEAPAFRANKGGLFRSLGWNGGGPYRLRASLWAGKLRLYAGNR
jgi:hypothetical protein